ncbi:hypothetical protein PUN28_020828 [Cardiocondyla obscurior]|uniref:Uncharacterized protein n=1 Tax=Cardiocondyla obscurior TaxID=286306 RepID=A0AAW2E7D5_9HYME
MPRLNSYKQHSSKHSRRSWDYSPCRHKRFRKRRRGGLFALPVIVHHSLQSIGCRP